MSVETQCPERHWSEFWFSFVGDVFAVRLNGDDVTFVFREDFLKVFYSDKTMDLLVAHYRRGTLLCLSTFLAFLSDRLVILAGYLARMYM